MIIIQEITIIDRNIISFNGYISIEQSIYIYIYYYFLWKSDNPFFTLKVCIKDVVYEQKFLWISHV